MYVQRCLLFHSSSFQLSVKNDARFVRFYSGLPHDWSRKLAPLSKPIRFKTETNLDLIAAFSRALDSLVVFGFPFFHLMIGPQNSCHFLNQSDSKSKPISTWSLASFRALSSLVFTLVFPLQRLAGIMALILRRPMRFSWVTNHEQCWLRHHITVTKV